MQVAIIPVNCSGCMDPTVTLFLMNGSLGEVELRIVAYTEGIYLVKILYTLTQVGSENGMAEDVHAHA